MVCDDANMGVTHVIRGDDHLSNTPRQILIYEALGFDVPTFAHLSMILGPDGKKLSKRHGAASVEEFCERGYLPDAMVNFLALLGCRWTAKRRSSTAKPMRALQPRPRHEKGRRVRRDEARLDERPVHQGNGSERLGAGIAAVAAGNRRHARGLEARPDFYLGLYPLVAERLTRLDDAAGKLAFMFWPRCASSTRRASTRC